MRVLVVAPTVALTFALTVALTLFVAGCGSGEFNMVPVSGTITMDGEPLEGAEVVFAPMEIKDQAIVGPASVGITDSNGKYTLKTPKGVEGAVVTKHRVAVSFGEIDEAAVGAKIDEVIQKDRSMPESAVVALERKVRREMEIKKKVPESYNLKSVLQMEVVEGTENANFDLKSDGS